MTMRRDKWASYWIGEVIITLELFLDINDYDNVL